LIISRRYSGELYSNKQDKKIPPLARQEIYDAPARLDINSPDELNTCFREYTNYFASCHGKISNRYRLALKIKALFNSMKTS